MSTFNVSIEEIRAIDPHPNADRLSLASILGWQVCVKKDEFKVGDLVVYFPIDSILPADVEGCIFGENSKVKLTKGRIKTIKLRGAISQGMATPPKLVGLSSIKLGQDVTKKLGVTKYEPAAPSYQSGPKLSRMRDKPKENPFFRKYGGLENYKNYPDLFEEGELVSITEKVHGTHFRAGYVPYVANTLWRKIKKFLKLSTPTHEFVFGSNTVQLQYQGEGHKTFYDNNVYAMMVNKYNLKEKLKPGEVVHGEIYGEGIQKGYNYGKKGTDFGLVLFDLRLQSSDSSEFIPVENFREFCLERNLDCVPELYRGPFNREQAKVLTVGDSIFCSEQKVREGVVIRPVVEGKSYIGRKVLKIISDDYLLGDQTDFH